MRRHGAPRARGQTLVLLWCTYGPGHHGPTNAWLPVEPRAVSPEYRPSGRSHDCPVGVLSEWPGRPKSFRATPAEGTGSAAWSQVTVDQGHRHHLENDQSGRHPLTGIPPATVGPNSG